MVNMSAGIGDPYEWSVGLLYALNMLGSDSGIKHTILQANNMQGLDDVVQVYENGLARCIQVKHTRVSNTLTFGDLVSKDEDEKGQSSKTLLQSICKDWHDAKIKKGYSDIEAILFTNRSVGVKNSKAKSTTIAIINTSDHLSMSSGR